MPRFARLVPRAVAATSLVLLGFGLHAAEPATPPRVAAERVATPPPSITVPEGFRVELLRSAQEGEDSWISMTFDPQGRILVGLDTRGVARLAPPQSGANDWSFERLDDTLKHCRGVLYAHGALYVNATDSQGFYRLRDADGAGRFEAPELLQKLDYRSRYGHGPNQITLGPDGFLYVVLGNDVAFPEGTSPESPYRHPQLDRLLPDPRDLGQDDRVGTITRVDPDGKEWTILAGGFRNQVDVAFNADGEMFTWDADMEWDVGLPWYRPTRLNHVVAGGEYGWRWGTSKWPTWYADSLPTTLDTGLGSPTGLVFGTESRFPARYRDLLYIADWQHGKILAVTLTPRGATYDAADELFAAGAPLNVCDLTFGPDGAMYFLTGGRGSQSGLYRISYVGAEDVSPPPTPAGSRADAEKARALRHRLESFQVRSAPEAIDELWTHLAHEDRWIRNAARVALERQDPALWRARIASEPDPLRRATALLALVRCVKPDELPLPELLTPSLPEREDALLTTLRAAAVAFSRGATLPSAEARSLTDRLAAVYPHPSPRVTREVCELLVHFGWPEVVSRTLPLLEAAAGQEEEIFYAHALLRFRGLWSLDERTTLLRRLRALKGRTGGHLYPTVLANMEQDLVESLTTDERTALEPVLSEPPPATADTETAPARPFVRRWTLEEIVPHLAKAEAERDPASGRQALAAASCLKCHRVESSGSAIGPDLTHVGRRFDLRALAESILEPSKVVDPKYHTTVWVLTTGQVLTGRSGQVSGKEITVELNPVTGETVKIARAEIESSHPSDVSPMPSGLLDTLTLDEILDLLAFLHHPAGSPDAR